MGLFRPNQFKNKGEILKLNKLNIVGILMILFAVLLVFTNSLDKIMLLLTYHFLEGSSQGKSIILFTVMGSILLLYPLFEVNGYVGSKISGLGSGFKFKPKKYLKITIILLVLSYLVGLLIELIIRFKYGVSPFTTFIAYNSHSYSSTALTHSHAFKSMLGLVISSLGVHINAGINAGVALIPYTLPLALVVFVTYPLIYIGGMIAVANEKRLLYQILLAFAVTVSMIGILDGGLFSTPSLVGLATLLGIYFIKKPFKAKDLIKPSVIIILLIILRVSLGIIGTNAAVHEITIINPSDNIDLQSYNVMNIQKMDNETVYTVPGNTNDKVLLMGLTRDLKGNATGFFLSWNIYSFV